MTSLKSLLFLTLLSLFLRLSTAEYNQTDAIEYAYTAAIAYCEPKSIESWKCGGPCQHLPGYQYFFAEKLNITAQQTLSLALIYNPTTKKFITSFRGTAGAYELLLEVLEGAAVPFTLYNITGAIVDGYFYTHYVNNIRTLVTTQLQKACESFPDFKYVFTGHSLGAALTTLTAFDVVTSGLIPRDQAVIYNYGSPRIGNQILASAIEAAIPEIYRLVHWKDTVPHLPPCKDVSGHCTTTLEEGDEAEVVWPAWHVTQQVFYNQDNTNYTLCVGGEDPNCMDKFLIPETDVLDHFYYLNIRMECEDTSVIPMDTLGKREVFSMESEVRSVGRKEMYQDFIFENKMFTYEFQT